MLYERRGRTRNHPTLLRVTSSPCGRPSWTESEQTRGWVVRLAPPWTAGHHILLPNHKSVHFETAWRENIFLLALSDRFFLHISPTPPPSFPLHSFVISSSCWGRGRSACLTPDSQLPSGVSPAAGPWHIHGSIYNNTSTRNRVFKVARRWSGCVRWSYLPTEEVTRVFLFLFCFYAASESSLKFTPPTEQVVRVFKVCCGLLKFVKLFTHARKPFVSLFSPSLEVREVNPRTEVIPFIVHFLCVCGLLERVQIAVPRLMKAHYRAPLECTSSVQKQKNKEKNILDMWSCVCIVNYMIVNITQLKRNRWIHENNDMYITYTY